MEVHALADHQRLYHEVIQEPYGNVQDNDIHHRINAAVLHQGDKGGCGASDNGAEVGYNVCHSAQNAEHDRIVDSDQPEPRRSQDPYGKAVSDKPAKILSHEDVYFSNDRNSRLYVRRWNPVHDSLHHTRPVLEKEEDEKGDENRRHNEGAYLRKNL